MAMEADSGEYWQPPETGRGSGQILTQSILGECDLANTLTLAQ